VTPRRLDTATVQAKLRMLRQLLEHLCPHRDVSARQLADDDVLQYAVQRMLTQVVDVAVAINSHVASAVLGQAEPATDTASTLPRSPASSRRVGDDEAISVPTAECAGLAKGGVQVLPQTRTAPCPPHIAAGQRLGLNITTSVCGRSCTPPAGLGHCRVGHRPSECQTGWTSQRWETPWPRRPTCTVCTPSSPRSVRWCTPWGSAGSRSRCSVSTSRSSSQDPSRSRA